MRNKFLVAVLSFIMIIFVTACGNSAQKVEQENNSAQSATKTDDTTKSTAGKKILVVYFSRTGENYEVGNISRGNTQIVAEMIATKVGADTFEIKPVKPYPENYKECTEVAKAEKNSDARPAIVGDVENFDDYDVIFFGYPNWWSDMPMIMYTFMESHNFNGKTVIPFCTSSSEYFIGKEEIQQYAKGSTVLDGLGIRGKRCQENPESVRQDVNKWLESLGVGN